MNHPYKKFEDTELWSLVSNIIEELIENQDIEENTAREYIVGYMCAELDKNFLLDKKK